MTTNPFFEPYEQVSEQDLWNDLIVESFQQYGIDVKYVPRRMLNYDPLLGADDSSKYDSAYTVEVLMKSILGFSGDRDFYSQFGHQVRDEVVFSVARDRFRSEVGAYEGVELPSEGDLIWAHMLKKLFVIKYVDPREMFYQHGAVYTWELTCEVFEASGEDIDTGDGEIDAVKQLSTNIVDWALLDGNGNVLTDGDGNVLTAEPYSVDAVAPGYQNDHVPAELEDLTGFDVRIVDPFDFLKSQ